MSTPLDPGFAAYLEAEAAAMAASPMPPLDQIPASIIREGYRAERKSQDKGPPQAVDVDDLVALGPEGSIPVRLYAPQDLPAPSGLLVYFHGGGWTIGDLETHDGHCRRLAIAGRCRVLAVDYRLAPEHPFPAGHDDALAATRWAFDHASKIGVDPGKVAVGGDSAGGNMAASVALDLRNDSERKLAFQLLLYPATSMSWVTESRQTMDGPTLTFSVMRWFEKNLAVGDHHQAHRLELLDADVAGVPPALVVTAGFDCLKDEGKAYVERLRAAGCTASLVEYATLPHDFFIMPDVSPAVATAVREVGTALRERIG